MTPTSRGSARVRIEDVASAAGVSAMTVSRALNRPDLVSAEKRKIIADAVKKTGYVPNLVAGNLASNRSQIIAIINPTLRTSIFSDLTQGMWDILGPQGYQLLMGSTDYSRRREDKLIKTFIGRQVDGLVLTGVSHSAVSRMALQKNNISVIETFDLPEDPIDMVVGFSAFDAAAEMGRLVAEWGYRNPAIITAPTTTDNRTQRRLDGFLQGLRKAKLKVKKRSICEADDISIEAGGDAFGRLHDLREDHDIVLCTNDILAVGALLAAQRHGYKIPNDVAITGFGDIEIAKSLNPALTTVRVRGYDIGRKIGALFLERLSTKSPQSPICDMGVEILRRESA